MQSAVHLRSMNTENQKIESRRQFRALCSRIVSSLTYGGGDIRGERAISRANKKNKKRGKSAYTAPNREKDKEGGNMKESNS